MIAARAEWQVIWPYHPQVVNKIILPSATGDASWRPSTWDGLSESD